MILYLDQSALAVTTHRSRQADVLAESHGLRRFESVPLAASLVEQEILSLGVELRFSGSDDRANEEAQLGGVTQMDLQWRDCG